jgi:hypothetical protein
VSIADQIGEAVRNGLQFLPLTDHRSYDQHYDPLWESSSLLLVPGEEANGSPHAVVLGAADSIVQGSARPGQPVFTRVQQSVWDAHSQDAVWSVAHPDDGEINDDGTPNVLANVQGINLVEMWNRASNIEKEIDYCENRWNAGFRFGVAGASDSHFRERWSAGSPGMPTTGVLAREVNERAVLDGLRGGRTSISSSPIGPFILLMTDMSGGGYTAVGGDEVIAPAGRAGHVRLHLTGASGTEVLLYRKPGRSAGPLAVFRPTRDDEMFTVDVTTIGEPDWIRAEIRAPGSSSSAPGVSQELRALSSPIFFSPSPVDAVAEISLPMDQGIVDAAVRAIGARGEFAGFPDVASESGFVYVVAERHTDSASHVIYRRRAADGGWSDAGRVLSGNGLARFPRVAARGRDVWVVWQEDARHVPHRPVILLRHSGDAGATWQPATVVRSLDGRAEHPDLAIGPSGRPLLVWQEMRSHQPFDVLFQEIGRDRAPRNLSGAGKSIDAGSPDDTRSPRYPASVWPAVAVASDGRVAVGWQDNRTDRDPLWTGTAAGGQGTNPDDWQIMVTSRSRDGVWSTPVTLGSPDLADRHPDIAFSAAGDLVVAWESKALRSSGANLFVQAAVSSAAGKPFSEPVVLAPAADSMSQRVRLGVDADGSIRAVWYDSRSLDWRWRIMTTLYGKTTGWSTATLLTGRGINTWAATAGGMIVFASTRNSSRMQRDPTQQIFVLTPP